jgi:hypothetical protein
MIWALGLVILNKWAIIALYHSSDYEGSVQISRIFGLEQCPFKC